MNTRSDCKPFAYLLALSLGASSACADESGVMPLVGKRSDAGAERDDPGTSTLDARSDCDASRCAQSDGDTEGDDQSADSSGGATGDGQPGTSDDDETPTGDGAAGAGGSDSSSGGSENANGGDDAAGGTGNDSSSDHRGGNGNLAAGGTNGVGGNGVGGNGNTSAGGTNNTGGEGAENGESGNGGAAGGGSGGASAESACIRRADVSAPADGDGLSWRTAYHDVQAAIESARAGGDPCEVWVAAGTYHIYATSTEDTVLLRAGVDVYGGFSGVESARDERDWAANRTTLTGVSATNAELRVAHVVTAQVDVILDGFTIVGGDATGSADPVGGGILSREGSPLIRNCIVRDNVADDGGGAWFSGPNPVVEDCAFWYNEATNSGGAMQLGSGELRRNQFAGNRAGDDCGGVGVNGAPVVENCVFRQNEAIDYAGGLCIGPGAGAAIVVNNTFYDNHAPHGGGALSVNNDTSVVANNVALDNTGQYGANILLFNGKLSSIHHNCGNGNMSGSDNVDADPQLTAPGNADFRLAATSPCIDAADDALAPPEDAAGAARYDVAGVGSSVADMGAFEARP